MSILYYLFLRIERAYLKWEAEIEDVGLYHLLIYSNGELPPDWPGMWAEGIERLQCAYCGHQQDAKTERTQDWPIVRRYVHECTNCGRWNDETDWQNLEESTQNG